MIPNWEKFELKKTARFFLGIKLAGAALCQCTDLFIAEASTILFKAKGSVFILSFFIRATDIYKLSQEYSIRIEER